MIRSGLYILLIGVFVMGWQHKYRRWLAPQMRSRPKKCLPIPCWKIVPVIYPSKLRCLVCQNQSIDDSDADLAKDLRREVRAQLVQGKTDEAILSDLRAKYGDFVLLAPPMAKNTMALWLAPIGFFFLLLA